MKKTTSNATSVPASFIVEELTDSENLIRFASFQKWLDGKEPFMIEGRIERSLAAMDVLPSSVSIDRSVTGSTVVAIVASGADLTVGMEVGLRYTEFRVSSTSNESAQQAVAEIRKRADALIDRSKVPVRVWSGHRGGSYDDRLLDSPPWSEIADNYPTAVRTQLTELMKMARPNNGEARLVLWHGEPGTGKTTALRSLAHEWQQWVAVQYISDPERVFNDTDYLATVLDEYAEEPQGPTLSSPSMLDEKWRLLVAEDSDEFLRSNARDRAGAALGRVLNLSDGILGQHHNVMLLLTTNEELSRLHPALIRPGRCLANIEFARFPAAEARKWLASASGVKPTASKAMTLAELLAKRGDIRAGANSNDSSPSIGAYL